MKFATKVIHAGIEPDPTSGAVMTPIYQTSTYAQESPGKHKGYEYARTQNPTRDALQKNLAALENGKHAICFSSGMAAMDAVIRLLNPGDEVIASNDLYGGAYRQLTKVHQRYGIKAHFVDMTDVKNVKEKINKNTKMIWVETPTNPMLSIVDIKKICALATSHKILTCVDNTFASPYLQTPLNLGADIVLHSATKYLGGHSDVVMGAVIVKNKKLSENLYFIQNSVGAIPGPQDCFLMLRGIKTLHLRVERACSNAKKIAEFLQRSSKVKHIYYPGLKFTLVIKLPKHKCEVLEEWFLSLQEDTMASATKLLSATHLFTLAESLGGVESLIGHPASMTHGSIPREERLKIGLTDSLIRLSVGVEDIDDLIDDLKTALSKVK